MNLKLSIVNCQLSIILLLFFTLPLKAQVTIGAQKAPHSYSVLELMSAKGLRLPMLSNSERDDLKLTSDSTEASGLVIYNTDIDCVEFWSDDKWIDLCNNTSPNLLTNNISLTSEAGTDAQTVCPGTAITPITYSTTGATGATVIGLPAGVTGSWNAGVVTISGTPATSGNYIVVLTGGSGTATGSITVPQLGAIIGSTVVQKGATALTYYVPPVSGATTYTWTVPTAVGTITDGQGTNRITIDASSTASIPDPAGTISVATINSCSVSLVSTLDVTIISGCAVRTTSGGWLTFMCYNLGAEDMSIADQMAYTPTPNTDNTTDSTVFGSLYQWGRQPDGHQLRISSSYLTDDLSGENSPVSDLDGNGQVNSSSPAFGKFIKSNIDPADWRSSQDNTLWSNPKTVNDPCPAGWRVPTVKEWESITSGSTASVSSIPAIGSIIAGNKWVWSASTNTKGWLVTPTGSSEATLFLPAAGNRTCGNSQIIYTNSIGYYWSSTRTDIGTRAYNITLYNTSLVPSASFYRATGFSVRCVSE